MDTINLTGRPALSLIQDLRPRVTLTFYQHTIILRKLTETGGVQEYPIHPDDLAATLAAAVEFSTGFLTGDTLYVGQVGRKRVIIEYRAPQLTGLWLEGSDEPIRIPLPGLVMRRVDHNCSTPSYQIFAVKRRPSSAGCVLYRAPLPNVSRNGTCWGTVAHPSPEAMAGVSLAPDWRAFLGSKFGNHNVGGSSEKHPDDIRKMYLELVGTRRYPLADLVPAEKNLGDLMRVEDRP